jgi:hypothetical protein
MSALRDFVTNTGIFCGPSRDEAVAELDRLEERMKVLRTTVQEIEMYAFRQYVDWKHFHEVAMDKPFDAESEAQDFAGRISSLATIALGDESAIYRDGDSGMNVSPVPPEEITKAVEMVRAIVQGEMDALMEESRVLKEQFDTAVETLRRVYRETEWTEADFADDGLAWQINGVLKAASIPAKEPNDG